ncbi:MAG: MFS transporter [Bacteroidetes bacterium]|nr:MFS transporter [Bacteroidota bacterium]MBU1677765.1 MFS transporter [Bacteroidota bacterium]MBU2507956.1 MFS transporter [Bacteroidota bacterium]
MLEFQKKLSNFFYVILSMPATAMGFALSIQIAALSWLMRTKYGLDLHEIGFVWAAGPLAGIIGQPIIGLISDNVWFWKGRRRPFIIIGGALAALMLLALPNIDKIDSFFGVGNIIVVAVAVALTLDLAINISFNPTRAIIADVTSEGVARTKGYTWMQTISGTFGVLAYAVGATMGNYFLIYAGSILVLAFSIVPMFFVEESRELSSSSAADEVKSTATNWNQFLKLLFAHSFSWIGVQTMFVYMIGFVEQNLSPSGAEETGMILAISFLILNAVGAILPAFVLEPITEKIGRVRTHLISVAIMSLGYFGIVFFGHSVLNVYIFMAVAGIGWAAIVSLPFAVMSELVDKTRMGLFMGLFNLSVVLPQLFVSLVLGSFIESAVDKNLIFIISGVSLAVSALLWLIVKDNKKLKVSS